MDKSCIYGRVLELGWKGTVVTMNEMVEVSDTHILALSIALSGQGAHNWNVGRTVDRWMDG